MRMTDWPPPPRSLADSGPPPTTALPLTTEAEMFEKINSKFIWEACISVFLFVDYLLLLAY